MSSSPFPYTCELCGAEGLTDEGMRTHTLEAHVAGRPECPFCDCDVPQPQLVGHVQRAHLHYLTPERELMAFIDDQSPSVDEDSKMTTDSCSHTTPGYSNGWHSSDNSSYQNGAISKNAYHNGYQENHNKNDKEEISRSPKNINLCNGLKNINLRYGVIPTEIYTKDVSLDSEFSWHDKKSSHSSSSYTNSSYEGSPNKNKLAAKGAGQGSPLRSQLTLKLKPNTPKKAPEPSPIVQCLLCDFTSTCSIKLEEHINRAHFDLTSPSVTGSGNSNANSIKQTTNSSTATSYNQTLSLDNDNQTWAMTTSLGSLESTFQCPICLRDFVSGSDVEMHVNVEHQDILSPQKTDLVIMEESPVNKCPVCGQPLPLSQHELIQHVEEHFERGEDGGATGLTDAEREAQRCREEQEFALLRAQYGMEEEECSYREANTNGLKRAVYSGALSVAGYYERSVGLRSSPAEPCTQGILERIAELNSANPSIVKTYLCSAVDHYASTYGDRGWGCGYRNMQMVLSSLVMNPEYKQIIVGDLNKEDCVPSIPQLQLLVEKAWKNGFDTQGSEQLGSKLYNTRKWIGACEVVTVLSSLRMRCQLIDFHKPTSPEGGHPALLDWVLRYFTENLDQYKPPLYIQHQGHSRTIIGYEKHRDGKATLLVLDPSHSTAEIRQIFSSNIVECMTTLRLLRRNSRALRARQYQLLCVTGLIADEDEYQASKVLQSVRIPE